MSVFHDPKFWVAVSSTIFFIGAFKPMKSAIGNTINEKISKIKSGIEEAESLKKEALEMLASAESRLASIEVESRNILENAKSQAQLIVKNAEEKLSKDIEIRKNMALSKIKNLEDTALEEIKKKVSAVTLLAVQTIVEQNLDDSTIDRLNASSIEKLPKNFH